MGRVAFACVGLLLGAAPGELCGQEAGASAPPAEPDQPLTSPPAIAAPPILPTLEIRGPDGRPLPPEVQQQLEAQYREQLGASTGAGGGAPEIVVAIPKPRGSAAGDFPAELSFDAVDLRALGANDVRELLETLGPRVGSARERDASGPLVLLNGRRISGLAEIARIPAEAIERLEVFPEEMALSYGFPAARKVVNVVTFERFDSRLAQLSYARPTEGGLDTPGAAATLMRIRGDTRLSLDGLYSRSGALLESERAVFQVDGAQDLARFRTLLPETERLQLSGTASAELLKGVSSTLTGSFDSDRSQNLFGIAASGRPVRGDVDTRTVRMGTTLGGRLGRWQWTFTGNHDRVSVSTRIDAGQEETLRNQARGVDTRTNADVLLNGDAIKLPAGPVSVSVSAGLDFRDFVSRSRFGGEDRRFQLARDRAAAQATLNVPLADRRKTAGGLFGDLSINANGGLEELSDIGTLRSWGYGLNWTPTPAVNLIASVTQEEGAPTVEQLGGPLVLTPNVRTFDFSRGETVDLVRSFGGNPALRPEDRQVISLGLTAEPFARRNLTVTVDYLRTRIDDPIAAFPLPLPQIEAAFPERFTRGADNRLVSIDARPLNFDRSDQEQIRVGFNFARPLGAVPAELQGLRPRFVQNEAEARRRLPAGASIVAAQPGTPGSRLGDTLLSRLYLAVYYTRRLRDEVRLRAGGATLDLLEGSGVDFSGGRPRHEIELQAGVFKRGLGARVTAAWVSGTNITGPDDADNTASDLRFAAYGTVDVNLFANLAERFGGANPPSWLKGSRVSIAIVNLFNVRPQVRDAAGAIPVIYQPAYLNPLGRIASLNLRKSF